MTKQDLIDVWWYIVKWKITALLICIGIIAAILLIVYLQSKWRDYRIIHPKKKDKKQA